MNRRLMLAITLILGSAPAAAQEISFDFETGLRGWRATGEAFERQPVRAADVMTDVMQPVSLGGDYWRGLTYPLGHQGMFLLSTHDDRLGRLVSDERLLTAQDRYFSVLVGGRSTDAQSYVELQIRDESTPGSYTSLFKAAATGHAALSRKVFPIPADLRGRRVRIQVVDDSTAGGISVDDVRFSWDAPEASPPPVWGLGDFHTHPMTHIAFGALHGVRAVWGVPGGAATDYDAQPALIERDIPRCEAGHRGGHSAEVFINSAEGRFLSRGVIKDLWALLSGRLTRHGRNGASSFRDFPSFQSGAHQQMHITQIRRAWAGGLRLMVAIAVHNVGVEFLTAKLTDGKVELSTEREVLMAQICGMRQLARLNAEWMEIAYDPQHARDIIGRGKLAVVLGVEMDQLGELFGGSSEDEVTQLWNLGIRQVTPIHAINNELGGAAVFQPVYNSLNDLLNRRDNDKQPITGKTKRLPQPPTFFSVGELGCGTPGAPPAGECVEFTFSRTQQRAVITRPITALFRLSPFIVDEKVSDYEGVQGMVNEAGLTPEGGRYLRALMSKGMVIGLEHMSRKSVGDVYRVMGDWLADRGHPECRGFGGTSTPDACFDAAYPLNVSHAHFRQLSLPRAKTSVAGFRASEYEVSALQADVIRRTGGFAGQFVSEDPVRYPQELEPLPFKNDCAGSSKSFATSLWYALQRLGPGRVGLATDFTFIPGASPRFGKDACSADAAAKNRKKERALFPDQYLREAQSNRVRYRSGGSPDGLVAYNMGRRYDFNFDGFAHYGLLPDLLQDVKNIGLPRSALEALFSSAETYLRTWEKAEGLAGNTSRTFRPQEIACTTVCNGLCPEDPHAGAPRRSEQRQ